MSISKHSKRYAFLISLAIFILLLILSFENIKQVTGDLENQETAILISSESAIKKTEIS